MAQIKFIESTIILILDGTRFVIVDYTVSPWKVIHNHRTHIFQKLYSKVTN